MNKIKKTTQSEQILDAASKCISSKGYANVSLRDIANEAGVALSQLHYYFGNKKYLFREIIKRVIEKYLSELEYHLKNDTDSKDRTSSLIKYLKNILENDLELFRILFDLTSLALWSDSFRDLLSSLFKDLTDMVEKFIINNSSLKEIFEGYTPKSLARIIIGAMFGIALQGILDSNNNEEIIDSLNVMNVIFE